MRTKKIVSGVIITIIILIILLKPSKAQGGVKHIIAGEASICPLSAKIAVAQMHNRGRIFNGYSNNPDKMSILAELVWFHQPDHSNGANFWFDEKDLKKSTVKRIIGDKKPVQVFNCAGTNVYLYW